MDGQITMASLLRWSCVNVHGRLTSFGIAGYGIRWYGDIAWPWKSEKVSGDG